MPITLRVDAADVLRCRFAISPVWETLAAVRTLLDPGRHAVNLPWLRASTGHQADARASELALLLPRHGYSPDFLTPAPLTPLTSIEEELARVRETPPERAAAELARLADSSQPRVRRLLDDPARAIDTLATMVEQWWHRLLAPDWNRIRATLDGDIAYRANRVAQGGMELVVTDLHVDVRWSAGTIVVAGDDRRRDLAGLGLVFVPSVFAWPAVAVITDPPWQPTLIYPARGVGALWTRATATAPDHLAALLGRTRAAILCALTEPISTTHLASRLGLSPATVSGHLGVLRRAGLATAHRAGHQMRYARSTLGHQLVPAG